MLDEADARELLDALVKRLEDAGGVSAQAHLSEGVPAAEIVALGEDIDADLIVVGNRGLGGVRRALMGSVSEAMTRHGHGPVLVVRNKEER
ncbi:MAG: universal stress protein [Actinobacteria bacterium]|nr:universal stress protein [Actinomycetota bacterium]